MDRNDLLIFFGLLLILIAGAIFAHADNGRYAFGTGDFTAYSMLDTRTGRMRICGQNQDACVEITHKAAYPASDKASRDSENPFAPKSDADVGLAPPSK